MQATTPRIGFGTVTRVALGFPEAFWPKEPHVLGFVAAQRGRWPLILNHAPISGHAILTAIATGPYAEVADAMTPAGAIRSRRIPIPQSREMRKDRPMMNVRLLPCDPDRRFCPGALASRGVRQRGQPLSPDGAP